MSESKFIKENGDYTEITSPIGRLSWVYVFEKNKKDKDSDKPARSLTIMLPKNEKALESLGLNKKQSAGMLAEVAQFKEEFEAEAMKVATAKFKAKAKATRWNPMLDGDSDKNTASFEHNANFWLIRCKTYLDVKVIDKKKDPIIDQEYPHGLFSGCWARVKLSLYTYDVDGNKGVAAGLGFFIKKIANDEEFKGGASAENAFDDDDELDDIGSLDADDDAFDDDDDDETLD